MVLETRGEDQPLEIRIITQHHQVLVMLRAHAQVGLKIKGTSQGLQCRVDRAKTRACRRQSVVNVGRFRLALERALEHLLRRHILTAI